MKKHLMSPLLLMAGPVMADGSVSQGLYAGAGLGFENASSAERIVVTQPDEVIGHKLTLKKRARSALFTLRLGYLKPRGMAFWALEGTFSLSNNKSTNYHPAYDDSLKSQLRKNFSVGLLSRVGVNLKRFSPFLTVGIEGARLSHLYYFDEGGGDGFRQKKQFFKPVLVVGGGVQTSLTSKLSLRLDYGYRIYKGFQSTVIDQQNTKIMRKVANLRSHAFSLSLICGF